MVTVDMLNVVDTLPVFVIFEIDNPFLFTAQGTHTFYFDKPLICVECPRLCALRGIVKNLLLL